MNTSSLSRIKSDISKVIENYGAWYGLAYSFFIVPIYLLIFATPMFSDPSISYSFAEANKEISDATQKYGRLLGLGYAGFCLLVIGLLSVFFYAPIIGCFVLFYGIA